MPCVPLTARAPPPLSGTRGAAVLDDAGVASLRTKCEGGMAGAGAAAVDGEPATYGRALAGNVGASDPPALVGGSAAHPRATTAAASASARFIRVPRARVSRDRARSRREDLRPRARRRAYRALAPLARPT